MPKSKNSLKYDRFHIFTPIIFIVCLKFNLCDAIHIQKFFRILYVAYVLPPYNIYDILVMLRHFELTIFLLMAVFFGLLGKGIGLVHMFEGVKRGW